MTSCEMDETSLICFENGSALLGPLFRVWDYRVLDALRRLPFVVPYYPCIEIVNESNGASFRVNRSFH